MYLHSDSRLAVCVSGKAALGWGGCCRMTRNSPGKGEEERLPGTGNSMNHNPMVVSGASPGKQREGRRVM